RGQVSSSVGWPAPSPVVATSSAHRPGRWVHESSTAPTPSARATHMSEVDGSAAPAAVPVGPSGLPAVVPGSASALASWDASPDGELSPEGVASPEGDASSEGDASPDGEASSEGEGSSDGDALGEGLGTMTGSPAVVASVAASARP